MNKKEIESFIDATFRDETTIKENEVQQRAHADIEHLRSVEAEIGTCNEKEKSEALVFMVNSVENAFQKPLLSIALRGPSNVSHVPKLLKALSIATSRDDSTVELKDRVEKLKVRRTRSLILRTVLYSVLITGTFVGFSRWSSYQLRTTNKVFDGKTFVPKDWSGKDFRGSSFIGTNMRSVDMSEANLSQVPLTDSVLIDVDFRGATLSGATLDSANLSYADLSAANLQGTSLIGAQLEEADLSLAILDENTILDGVDMTKATLNGTQLGRADLSTVINLKPRQLETADYSEAICPSGISCTQWLAGQE